MEFRGVGGELRRDVVGRSFDGVVVNFGRGVAEDCCYLSVADAEGRGGVFRRPHGVELERYNVNDVGGVVVVVGEIDVYIKAGVILGIVGVDAGDVVVLDYDRVEALCCRVEEERML